MVKRFEYHRDESGSCMVEDSQGEYVTYQDYAALQAHLDRVMLEHCPEEMTEEQKDNWKRNQRPALRRSFGDTQP